MDSLISEKNDEKQNVLKIAYDATPTWSGFNYQAKVALYLVLNTINQIKINTHETSKEYEEEIKTYELELEWIEDISIVKSQQYLSIHQVKAKEETNLSTYKDAIWGILHKLHHTGAKNGYLHTIKKLEAISLEKITSYLPSTMKIYSELTESKLLEEIFPNFSLFQYSNGNNYLYLDEIDNEIKKQLKIYYKDRSEQFIGNAYLTLLNFINDHVVERHMIIHQQKISKDDPNRIPERITFKDFINVLEVDYEKPSSEYLMFELKYLFNKYADEFIGNYSDDDNDKQYFESAMAYINQLSMQQFMEFAKKVNPHEKIAGELDLDIFHSLFQKNSAEQAFFSILYYIKEHFAKGRTTYYKNDKFYLPTTISLNSNHLNYEKIIATKAKDILENEKTLPLLFEIHCLISGGGEFKELKIFESKINYDRMTEEHRNHITKALPIKMIDLKSAIKELNDIEEDN